MLDLEFRLKPSKQYIGLILLALVISVMIIFTLPISALLKLVGLLLTLVYVAYILWHFGLMRSKNAISGIRRRGDGKWHVYTKRAEYEVEVSGDSTVTGLVSVLRFRVTDRFWQQSCVVFRDSLAAQQYRELLVVLKMG